MGSIVALFVVLIKFGPWLTISVFGQIFFVIGLMVLYSGIRNHNFSPPFLIFIYLGLAAIISGLVLQYDLYINPDYPHCFKEEGESGRQAGVEIVLGIFFMCISILAFCLMFFRG